ncbi:hypothetical protein Tco_0059819 [Tanacetum coccineum]
MGPEPEYPEFMPPEVLFFPAEEQPLLLLVSNYCGTPTGIYSRVRFRGRLQGGCVRILRRTLRIYPADIGIPESCLPPRKRPRLASPTPIYEVGETSAAGAARHDVPAIPREDPYVVARENLYKFVDLGSRPQRQVQVTMAATVLKGATDSDG